MESTRDLPIISIVVETPLQGNAGAAVLSLDPVLVPVLRAGLGFASSFLQLLPTAKVGRLGLCRDHDSLVPVPYYRNFPPFGRRPRLRARPHARQQEASASEAVRRLKVAGARKITLASVLAAPKASPSFRRITRLAHGHRRRGSPA
ncbi:MAG: hypothetical protein IPN59_08475 [Holophaga sp.]|nr:hypothetical protein [Holophaga sp.]